jgi:hypothetical protein
VRAEIATADGVYVVDLEDEEVIGFEPERRLEVEMPRIELPLVIAAASVGPTIVAVVDRRPPLMVSHDAGRTWREAGGGLPPGRAVAIAEDDPDYVLYAARNRLHLSRDGGRFWSALAPELPEIEAVALREV